MPHHRIAIFASGNGSNAEQLITHFHNQAHTLAQVALIVCNRPDAFVLERARKWHIPTLLVDRHMLEQQPGQLLAKLHEQRISFIVLAGFLWLIPPEIIRAYPQRIINIHPALLPRFGGKGMYGMHVHRAVIAAGETESGITIHYVNEHYDQGQIIFQSKISIQPGMSAEALAAAIQRLEHLHYPNVVEQLLRQLPASIPYSFSKSNSSMERKVQNALISVYHKQGIEPLLHLLHKQGVSLYSTGGTYDYIQQLGLPVQAVEALTGYPAILGGRVKTLHPKIFGGILARRHLPEDQQELRQHDIPVFELVVVDLYPFEQTLAAGASEQDIIEQIDIGGISLIRAAAKNFQDVAVVASQAHYKLIYEYLKEQNGYTTLEQRRQLATLAFDISSHYDTAIFHYFNQQSQASQSLKLSQTHTLALRYGENPHQAGYFHGRLEDMLEQLHGKALSYNNLMDIDAAIELASDFVQDPKPFFAIIKHNNACGAAYGSSVAEAYQRALAADPVSAFGGVLISTRPIDTKAAHLIHELFVEVLIAPAYDEEALRLLQGKKNRILCRVKHWKLPDWQLRTALNGILRQERNQAIETPQDLQCQTQRQPTPEQINDMLFANRIVKHTKSNAIVLVRQEQLIGSGTGQTSRVDALRQAIAKAHSFGLATEGAVMASDAFFPFVDCVQIAHQAGIEAVIQPGGSVRDQDSIDFCNAHNLCMVFTGRRHFKH